MIERTRPVTLTDVERVIFGKPTIRAWDRAAVAPLWEPFRDHYRSGSARSTGASRGSSGPSASAPG